MKKYLVLVVVAGLASGVASFARAEPFDHTRVPLVSTEDVTAFTDAHIAALKAGLKLTPAQEKNWPTLETTLRAMANNRADRLAEWQAKPVDPAATHNAIDRLRLRAQRVAAYAAEMEKLADAAKPLYDSLDEAQQRRFGPLLREATRGHGGGWAGWRRWGRRN